MIVMYRFSWVWKDTSAGLAGVEKNIIGRAQGSFENYLLAGFAHLGQHLDTVAHINGISAGLIRHRDLSFV